ncbi:MAG: hypothetical protein DHS80DRAFT_32855 [Piptocephalis tieghemiana]|nr:MAG: hypothetical protein DHS80DRAFT_32855 [Piptocephalis tieghemiana]
MISGQLHPSLFQALSQSLLDSIHSNASVDLTHPPPSFPPSPSSPTPASTPIPSTSSTSSPSIPTSPTISFPTLPCDRPPLSPQDLSSSKTTAPVPPPTKTHKIPVHNEEASLSIIHQAISTMDHAYRQHFSAFLLDERNIPRIATQVNVFVREQDLGTAAAGVRYLLHPWGMSGRLLFLRLLFRDWFPDVAGLLFALLVRRYPDQYGANTCLRLASALLEGEPLTHTILFTRSWLLLSDACLGLEARSTLDKLAALLDLSPMDHTRMLHYILGDRRRAPTTPSTSSPSPHHAPHHMATASSTPESVTPSGFLPPSSSPSSS